MKLKLRNITTPQAKCKETDEMYSLIYSLPQGIIDGVIGGHVHDVVHHWFNDIPMIQSVNGGFYFNVLYYTFNKTEHIVDTKIEGPIPVCEKIFENIKKCSLIKSNDANEGELRRFKFHDKKISADLNITAKFEKWLDIVKPYKEIIAYTEIDKIGSYDEEHALGDIVTDGMKQKSNANVALVNEGSFRTFWPVGPITYESIFDMFHNST